MKTSRFLTSAAALIAVTGINLAATAPAAEAALSQCPSSYMCLWSKPNYRGDIKTIAAVGGYKPTVLKVVGSYYNNRSKRTWLHATSNGSGTFTCLEPGARDATLSGWQSTAKAVYLATITAC